MAVRDIDVFSQNHIDTLRFREPFSQVLHATPHVVFNDYMRYIHYHHREARETKPKEVHSSSCEGNAVRHLFGHAFSLTERQFYKEHDRKASGNQYVEQNLLRPGNFVSLGDISEEVENVVLGALQHDNVQYVLAYEQPDRSIGVINRGYS